MFISASITGRANELLTQTLLGVPLRMSRLHAVSTGAADVATWLMIGWAGAGDRGGGETTRRVFRDEPVEGPVAALGVLQFATAVVAVFVPVGAGSYLLTTVTWTLGQRVAIRRVQRRDKELALP